MSAGWPISGVRVLVLIVAAGCAHRVAARTTAGVASTLETKLSEIDKEEIADRVARSTTAGTVSQLASPEQLAMLQTIASTTSAAVARGLVDEVRRSEGAGLDLVADRAALGAIAGLGRGLEQDAALRDQLTRMSRELSASAMAGARDELARMFPDCPDGDRRTCIERQISDVSRAAARGVTAGIVDAAKLPLMALAFLAGVAVALLFARSGRARERARSRAPT